jgi:glycosyltransferase involved in cell wall biosynthesis
MSRVGLAPEVIRGGENGDLVDLDEVSVAAGIREVAALTEQDAGALRARCAESASRFAWSSIALEYLDALDRAASARSHSTGSTGSGAER